MKKIIIFPGCTIKEYLAKGEIKERYYNPDNFFDEVYFFTFTKIEIENNDIKKIQKIVGNAKIFVIPLGNMNKGIFGLFSLIPILKNAIKIATKIKPSCIRSYTQFFEGYVAAFCAKKINVPFIISLHTAAIKEHEYANSQIARDKSSYLTKLFNNLNFKVKYFLEQYSINRSAIALPVSFYLYEALKETGFSSDNFKVLYNKVYVNNFVTKVNQNKANLTPIILTVGSLISRKNQDVLIRAVAGEKLKLQIIGRGPRKEILQNLAVKLNCNHMIEFIDSVPNSELPDYYSNCDIVALSPYYEGFCIPVLEGMAASKPVVVANVCSLPEVLGGCGLVVKNEPLAFKLAFNKILGNPHFRKNLEAKAFNRAVALDGQRIENEEKEMYSLFI
jgi:glycosyltransferase involved in cell wall biosynthesis